MENKDFTCRYTITDYAVLYKNIPVFMAGTDKKRWAYDYKRPCKSNIKLNRESAQREMQRFISGRITPYEREMLKRIDAQKGRNKNADRNNDCFT